MLVWRLAAQSPLVYEVGAYFGTEPAPVSVLVDSIALATVSAGKGKKGQAVVTVLDNLGSPVAGATVRGTFSGSYSETVSGATGANGAATLTTNGVVRGGVAFQFCVDSVSSGSLAYEPAENRVTCGSF